MNNVCPSCGAVYSVSPAHVGRRISCKKCSVPLVVTEAGIELVEGSPFEGFFEAARESTTTPASGTPPVATKAPSGEQPLPPTPTATREATEIRRGGGNSLVDFLLFRSMIVPYLIQILFWLGVAVCVLTGILTMLSAFVVEGRSKVVPVLTGLAWLIAGPVGVRIYCELLMVLFRIYDTLRDIRDRLDKADK